MLPLAALPLFDQLESQTPRLPPPVQAALGQGATVIAANARAARALHTAYAEDQHSAGARAWSSPRILDWAGWVAELEQHYARVASDAPMPLTPLQEQQLWSHVQGSDRDRVVAPRRMAELAQQAYALLGAYSAHALRRQAAAEPFGQAHEDAERFFAWASAFDRICAKNGWQSRTQLEAMLAVGVHLLPPQPQLYLVGFDRKTPAQSALLAAFTARGSRVEELQSEIHPEPPPRQPATLPAELPGVDAPPSPRNSPLFLRAADLRQELEACAWWCRSRLAAPARTQPRIGVILPEIRQVRAELDRIFRRVLMPQTTLWAAGPSTTSNSNPDPRMPYEFSLGAPLASYPVIRAALLLLTWLRAPLDASEATWLLTSGLLATTLEEHAALPLFDAAMRRVRGAATVSASPLVSMAGILGRPLARHLPPSLRTRLERLQARIAREGLVPSQEGGRDTRRRTFAAWAELVPSLLAEVGWPGHDPADSLAWQAQQRWTRLLGELALLGFDGTQPTWAEFAGILHAQAESVIFAAESASAPIQVLGAFESSGQTFDAVWFLGADDAHWPAVGRPHPLLPSWLQRKAAMPHATPQADWQLGSHTTDRILASAPEVVVSYAAQDKGMEQRPSPLLHAPAWRTAADLLHDLDAPPAQTPGVPRVGLTRIVLESVADDSGALPWPQQPAAAAGEASAAAPSEPEPSPRVAGGAEVLKRQAACAFQSFAATRLQAAPLEEPGSGLDPRQRGTLLHTVLEQLWTTDPSRSDPLRLHTHEDLDRATQDGTLPALVAHHVDAALAPTLADHSSDPWVVAYLGTERERLLERLLAWLACERERQPFSVRHLELPLNELAVGPLRLNVRPDRVDALTDGTHLLLDYKTSKVDTAAWDGNRPKEPQLPLYAIFGGLDRVSAVAFAKIRADETALLARAEDPSAQVSPALGNPSVKNRFDDEVRDGWREALLALADDFATGHAAVNPRDGVKTCKWCKLGGLCRVQELGGARDPDDDDSEEANG